MTFQRLLFSGAKFGAMASMRGSFWFTLIAVPVFGRDILFEMKELGLILLMFFLGFIFCASSCFIYSILPGVIGGIGLSFSISKFRIDSPKKLRALGGLIGGLSGLLISFFVIFLLLRGGAPQSPFDPITLVFGGILATLMATVSGVWCAFRLNQAISLDAK